MVKTAVESYATGFQARHEVWYNSYMSNPEPGQKSEFFKTELYFSAVIAIGLILLKIIQSFI